MCVTLYGVIQKPMYGSIHRHFQSTKINNRGIDIEEG